ncbi:hypothetical protein F4810DRAFT_144329 [Camillea tinctor]|nr:hypothetical protein F4810DRAFT_144329 [Camillea tinctor]
MNRRGARSMAAANKRVTGENDSQDSQAALLNLMILHGVGACSSSPPIPNDFPSPQKVLNNFHFLHTATTKAKLSKPKPKPKPNTRTNTSTSTDPYNYTSHRPIADLERDLYPIPPRTQDASDASSNPTCEPDAAVSSSARQSSDHSYRVDLLSVLPSPPSRHRHPHPHAAATSTLSRDDVLSPPAPLGAPRRKNKTHKMSSQTPTQSNEDRSYEQYTNEDDAEATQPLSTQGSSLHEHRTLHEHDTGFLDFNAQLDLPDTAPTENDTNPAHNLSAKFQVDSQTQRVNGPAQAPETPAIVRLFAQGDNEPLMGASQLFGQTQWTSALKKASPTSSRPSPHLLNHNTISPNHAISSPLKDRGLRTSPTDVFVPSSPGFPRSSSRPLDSKDSPTAKRGHKSQDQRNAPISETPSPEAKGHKSKKSLEPISEYKSYRMRSEENNAGRYDKRNDDEDSDSEQDEAHYRRLRAKYKKARASKSFPAVSIVYPGSDKTNVEVPSTSRTEPHKNTRRTDSERHVEQCYGEYPPGNDSSQETVADSQEISALQKSVEVPENVQEPPNESCRKPDDNNDVTASSVPVDDAEYRETIPETSPPDTRAEAPRLISDILNDHSSASTVAAVLSFPAISSSTAMEQEKEPALSEHKDLDEQGNLGSAVPSPKLKPAKETNVIQSSPSLILESSQQGSTRRSTKKVRDINTPLPSASPHPPVPSAPSDAETETSSLTNLSTTPNITPGSTGNSEHDTETHASSPTVAKARRRDRLEPSMPRPLPLPKMRTYSRSRDRSVKSAHQSPYSSSADELARSPSLAGSMEYGKSGLRKVARQSLVNQASTRVSMHRQGIFEGMAFAISFQEQSKSQRGKEKHTDRNAIERMIRQEGGRILADGFNTLFTFSPSVNTSPASIMPNSLQLRNEETGFTALIADGHSRKVKYMQALALGIPCLAPRWVTTCVAKREVVDWSSYLLCAGPSALLGDAIRSRNLRPYDASTAKLADVIRHRPKLLEESRILLVMRKSKNEEKRLPYVFLAQVLGASLVRVHTLEEARARLRKAEDGENEVFDWVYVDDHLHDAQTALFGPAPGEAGARKRKRQSAPAAVDGNDRPPKRIRTLNDELVIQSLILGRLIEEGEMEE